MGISVRKVYQRILNRGPPKQADMPILGYPLRARAVSAIKSADKIQCVTSVAYSK